MRSGLLISVTLAAASAAAQGVGALDGSVYDSLRARPLAGAVVIVEGTTISARTDSAGRFSFDSVPAGSSALSVESASLDSLGIGVAPVRTRVVAGARTNVALASPSRATLTVLVCGGRLEADAGVLIGVVRDAATSTPAASATVNVEWTALAKMNGGAVAQRAHVAAPVSDRGLYRACGVPAGGNVQLRATAGARTSGLLEIAIAPYGFARRDLLVGGDSGGDIRGVVRDSAGAPLAGASVTLSGDSAAVATDMNGAFVFAPALTGTRALEVRRLGSAPWTAPIDIRSDATTIVTITMHPAPAELAAVTVHAAPNAIDADAAGFDARKTRGNGRFIDRKAIGSRGDVEALELLRGTPGIQLSSLRGVTVATWTRSEAGCRPALFLDGVRTDSRALPHASQIEGVEIYSPSEVPPRFATASMRCAVVLFWTRRAPAARAPPDTGGTR